MSDPHDPPADLPELGAHVEQLLGKHLLGSTTPAEEAELRALAAREPSVSAALEVLEGSAAAFRDSPLAHAAEPNPSAELSALLADRERALAVLSERARRAQRGRLTSFLLWSAILGLIFWKATQQGWGWSTWTAPEWWWIPALFGLGAIHQVVHAFGERRRRERLAAGGEDWDALVARVRQPLTGKGLLAVCVPALLLAGVALAIGVAEPPLLLASWHVGWRHVIAIALGYLASVPLWRLQPFMDAVTLRLQAERQAQVGP